MGQMILERSFTLSGVHHGAVRVVHGSFTLMGTLWGALEVRSPATALVVGWQHGDVAVVGGALVVVIGALDGDVVVELGGRLVVDPGGRLRGHVDNEGVVLVRGSFDGHHRGRGEVRVDRAGLWRRRPEA